MKTFKQFQEGLVKKPLVGAALATPFLAKKFLKPKTDKMLDTERKTNKIGGEYRSGNTDFQKGVESGSWIGKTAPNSLAHNELNEVVDFIARELNIA